MKQTKYPISTDNPLRVVTFWWNYDWAKHHQYGWDYEASDVFKQWNQLNKHLTAPFEYIVFTDSPSLLQASEVPFRVMHVDKYFPELTEYRRCFRRLKTFDPSMKDLIGPRFLRLDLDLEIVGNIDFFAENKEEFVGYRDSNNLDAYAGSLMLTDAGAHSDVWSRWNLNEYIDKASSQFIGSDQAWQSYIINQSENKPPKFTDADGIHDFWQIEHLPSLPENTKMVMVNGMARNVNMDSIQRRVDWLQ